MSDKNVPVSILPEAPPYVVQAYPLRLTLDMVLRLAAEDWYELPVWRRTLVRWLTGRDWGVSLHLWADLVPATEEDRYHTVMVDREELKARFP